MYYLNILHFNNIKPAMNYCLLIRFQQLCNLLSRRNSIMKNQLLHLLLARLGQNEHEAVYFYVSYSFCVLTSFLLFLKIRVKFVAFSQHICLEFKTCNLRLCTCFSFFIWNTSVQGKWYLKWMPTAFIFQMIVIFPKSLFFFLT